MTDEEVALLEESGAAYEKRQAANRRFHCTCGRFVRGRTVKEKDAGWHFARLTWVCSHCGPCSE